MPTKGKKTTNTYRFQNFAERISNINIDVHRTERVASKEIPEDDKDTFFRESLERWAELNCSIDFTEFYRKVKPLVRSFNQLVYHKDKIIDLLKEYLGKKESLAHEPCLELLAELSKDLLDDFYAYFDQLFPVLVNFLGTQDTKLIENTFICFAYLFKSLWRWMLKDLQNFFALFSSLLSTTQKHHIQVFAAEAFAFLIRKSKDKQKTIIFLLGQISDSLADGIGYLLFHSIKGIKGQLSLGGEEFLITLLKSLYDVSTDKDEVLKSLKITWITALKHTRKENCKALFSVPCQAIQEFVSLEKNDYEILRCLLIILIEAAAFKEGRYVDKRSIILALTSCMKSLAHVSEVRESLHTLMSKLIVSYGDELSDLETLEFVKAYVNEQSNNPTCLIQFFQLFTRWYKFDLLKPLVLSHLSKHFKKAEDRQKILEFFVEIVHGIDPRQKLCEPFDLELNQEDLLKLPTKPKKSSIYKTLLKDLTLELWVQDPSLFWVFAVVLTHMDFTPSNEELSNLYELVNSLLNDESQDEPHHLFALAQCIQCFLVLSKHKEDVKELNIHFSLMKNLIRRFPSNDHVLQAFENFASLEIEEEVKKDEIIDVFHCIKKNLNCPFKLTRILTMKILDHFNVCFAETEKDKLAFQLCIQAENVESNLETYRDRLMHIQKLTLRSSDPYSDVVAEAVLRFLIGNLFINFSLVWEPTVIVIKSFMNDENKLFWTVWAEILEDVAETCMKPSHKEDVGADDKFSTTYRRLFIVIEDNKADQRPDFHNFRSLIWNAMTHFSIVAERKSKDIVPIFFQFLEKEYTQSDEQCLKTQNISAERISRNAEEKDQLSIKKVNKDKLKSLCSHLQIFTHMQNPKSMKEEKKLFQLYLEFLSNKDHDVQSRALACLQAYKFPHLKPYAESFAKLMDDSTFREELVKFSSEEESTFKLEHKENLLPILIRLLYGKLQRKSGLGMSGKTSLSARRNIIMQFLANCNHSEVKTFINLITDPLKHYEGMDILSKEATVDITAIVPLMRQTSYCSMFSTVVSRLRKLAVPYLPQLLGLLLRIVWTNSWCIDNKKDETSNYLSRMKDLRTSGILKLIELFNAIPEFNYNEFIEEIFAAAVWPKLSLLVTEASQNITPLFQLILCWSKNSRYFPLLCKEDADGNSLISSLYKILDQKSLVKEMEKQVMMISLNLLTYKDFEENVENGKAVVGSERFGNEETVGIQIIKPHVQKLLEYLYKALHTKSSALKLKSKQKIGSIIPHLQLSILANISKFVTDRVLCEKIVSIFFPILHCVASEEVQVNIITTIQNLLPYLGSTTDYLPLVPSLFSVFQGRKPRIILCNVYKTMCEGSSKHSEVSEYVSALNSWDAKFLEEPDYNRRLSAYRSITTKLAENEQESLDVDLILPILHNCFFYVNSSSDMSLRDASSSCIESIIKWISDSDEPAGEMFTFVVAKTILPAILQGLKLKNAVARYEYIHFLEFLVKSFDLDCFADLRQLSSTDPEVDFFQNIRHVQMHRRTRAIHLLTEMCGEKKLTNKTLFTFILPMISHVIFDNLSQTKDHNLLTGTIESIGAIVKCFPWSKYCNVLKNYLKVLQKDKRNQKTIIRVVVVVLNNFAFDLSNVTIAWPNNQPTTPKHKVGKVKATTPAKASSNTKKTSQQDERVVPVAETGEHDGSDHEDDGDDDDVDNDDTEEDNSKIDEKTNERIFLALTSKILPQLHRFFIKKSRAAYFHKLSNNHDEDEEEILKVPVALALVKLLKHLPKETLLSNLSGILLRVSQSLKSQARDVRDMARDTLKKIAFSLGSTYLTVMVKEMKSVLLRGYQLHVLGYSVHAVLESMQSEMKSGDLDGCVTMLMQIATEELFGTVAEEKAVAGITVKLHEAKSKKSNEMIEIIAKFVSSGSFSSLISPLKEVLDSTQDHKTRRKVEEAFRRISIGLQQNQGVAAEDLLMFIHGIISNTLPGLLGGKKTGQEKETEASHLVREDIYLMPDRPSRSGILPSVSKLTNEHVLVEFGLQQLYTGLKRSRFLASNAEHVRMLDPFVDVLEKSLTSKHTKVVTLAIRCISLLVKHPVPSLKTAVPEIAKQIFKLIKKFASAGAGKGDNYEMILSSFKAMTIIIRDYKDYDVTNKQLHVLLAYVEEDIYDSSRQATALPLLKAILSRKLSVTEITDIMKKIADLSIRDADTTTRLQCRHLMMIYLVDYPLGKKISKQFDFYISHLTYDEETGRISALEMLAVMFNKFPEKVLLEFAGYFFIPLVMMLVNDESATCRKMAGSAVKLLLTKVNNSTRDDMFDIILNWSTQEKVQLRQISMQLIGTFVEVEAEQIITRLDKILPIITKILQDGVTADQQDDGGESSESENEAEDDLTEEEGKKGAPKVSDKCLYNTLTCIGKLFPKVPLDKLNDTVPKYMNLITELLLHSHAWVRLSASQLFGLYFSFTPVEEMFSLESPNRDSYLSVDMKSKVKDLCLIFYQQLKDNKLTKGIAEQATKNLIYLAKVIKHIDPQVRDGLHVDNLENGETEEEQEEDATKPISLKVIVRKMCRLASFETQNASKDIIKRTCVFRWIAAICLDGPQEKKVPYLTDLLKPLHREITTSNNEESELTKLAQEVVELIRSQMDKQTFAEIYAKVQKISHQARESRKRKLAVEAVADPERYAQRKQKSNFAKREQRKRKLYEKKPELRFKKIRSKPEN